MNLQTTIKPPNDFHAGTGASAFKIKLDQEIKQHDVTLDLSDVLYMDSFTFRIVFDFLSRLEKVIPPKNQHIIDNYNLWLDSKKGLTKNNHG